MTYYNIILCYIKCGTTDDDCNYTTATGKSYTEGQHRYQIEAKQATTMNQTNNGYSTGTVPTTFVVVGVLSLVADKGECCQPCRKKRENAGNAGLRGGCGVKARGTACATRT